MCTVTINPSGNNDFVLTSNRDEAPSRISHDLDFYQVDDTTTLYPKDELSGGTWIGVSQKKRLVCVLNGGFVYHQRKTKYRISRGLVAKDFMIAEDIVSTLKTYNLQDIEPFTIVIADWNNQLKIFELVWDGVKRHVLELPLLPKIWSSSTLYTKEMKNERIKWFEDFKREHELDARSLLKFHKTAGSHNDDFGILMNRGFVKTTSITQVIKQGNDLEMRYENLQNNSVSTKTLNLPQFVNE